MVLTNCVTIIGGGGGGGGGGLGGGTIKISFATALYSVKLCIRICLQCEYEIKYREPRCNRLLKLINYQSPIE